MLETFFWGLQCHIKLYGAVMVENPSKYSIYHKHHGLTYLPFFRLPKLHYRNRLCSQAVWINNIITEPGNLLTYIHFNIRQSTASISDTMAQLWTFLLRECLLLTKKWKRDMWVLKFQISGSKKFKMITI